MENEIISDSSSSNNECDDDLLQMNHPAQNQVVHTQNPNNEVYRQIQKQKCIGTSNQN